MNDGERIVIDKNILSSTHISFLFGAGVNGSALPQLSTFVETKSKLKGYGVFWVISECLHKILAVYT